MSTVTEEQEDCCTVSHVPVSTSTSSHLHNGDFHGVYLLYCLNERYLGLVYIGYTTCPRRRLRQHNAGSRAGGARRTSNRGPWQMVLVVHGFISDIAALRFEWAWQHPRISRRLRDVRVKKARESRYEYTVRVLGEMLSRGPWCRLPLTVCWLQASLRRNLTSPPPPSHVPVLCGSPPPPAAPPRRHRGGGRRLAVEQQEEADKNEQEEEEKEEKQKSVRCYVCGDLIESSSTTLHCLSPECHVICHVMCMARHFLLQEEQHSQQQQQQQLLLHPVLPVTGTCPSCDRHTVWGHLVQQHRAARARIVTSSSVSHSSQ